MSAQAKTSQPRGLVRVDLETGKLHHERWAPAADLAGFIEHFWSVQWTLGEGEHQQVETLPYPSVHLVFERGASEIVGVMRGKFVRELSGEGCVFGIKFHPGAFRPFYGRPVKELANRRIPPANVLGATFKKWEREILAAASVPERQAVAENFLLERLPPFDPEIDRITALTRRIIDDRTIVRVEQLAELSGLGVRALQRLFGEYVGATPKWVIGRYRIQDALERVRSPLHGVNWATLARELGYADQAHFIRDFKGLIGATPRAFATQGEKGSP